MTCVEFVVVRGWRFLGRCFLWSIFLSGCVVRGEALIDVFSVLGAGDVVDLIVDLLPEFFDVLGCWDGVVVECDSVLIGINPPPCYLADCPFSCRTRLMTRS